MGLCDEVLPGFQKREGLVVVSGDVNAAKELHPEQISHQNPASKSAPTLEMFA